MITVRRASAADSDRLAMIHVTSWQIGYAGLMPADYLEAMDLGASEDRWADGLGSGGGGGLWKDRSAVVDVALDESAVVQGFVTTGVLREASAEESAYTGEVRAIYVHPDSWRRGFGRALLAAGEASLLDQGFRRAALWVLESNIRARRFYERAGWAASGASRADHRFGFPLTEVRYERTIV